MMAAREDEENAENLAENNNFFKLECFAQSFDLLRILIVGLVSISPTFYEQLLRQNPFAKKLQTQIVST
jgi:hypothetical protein